MEVTYCSAIIFAVFAFVRLFVHLLWPLYAVRLFLAFSTRLHAFLHLLTL